MKADAHGIYFALPHNGSARAAHAWRWCRHAVWQGPEGDAWGEMLRGVRAGEGFFFKTHITANAAMQPALKMPSGGSSFKSAADSFGDCVICKIGV